MANQYWGENPEILSVESSPTPSNTVFAVSSAVNLLEEQYVLVQVSGELERTQITNVSGNTLTVSPALSSVPDVPGIVQSSRELITKTKLNAGAVFNAESISELENIEIDHANQGLKYLIPDVGLYQLDLGSSATVDGFSVVATQSGLGRWIYQFGRIPAGAIIIWTGVACPSGWSRETVFDGLFIKGAATGVEPNLTPAGSNSHSHDLGSHIHSMTHTHNLGSHTHTFTTGQSGGQYYDGGVGGSNIPAYYHTHSGTTDAATGSTGSASSSNTGSAFGNTGSANNDPRHVTILFCKKD